jgi:Tfp pilus assembly protein PilN
MTAPNELSFLPEDYIEKKYTRRANIACGALLILAVGGVGFVFSMLRTANAKVEASFAEVDNKYIDAARKIEQVKRMHEKQREVVHHAELAASLVEKVPRSNILAEITNSLPTGVSLLDLQMRSSLQKDTSAPPPSSFAQHKAAIEQDANTAVQAPRYDVKITITGIANDDVQVAQLMTHLSHSSLFSSVNLVISDVYQEPQNDRAKNDKAPTLRKWQIEMMLNPQAEVREDKTAAVELGK